MPVTVGYIKFTNFQAFKLFYIIPLFTEKNSQMKIFETNFQDWNDQINQVGSNKRKSMTSLVQVKREKNVLVQFLEST